MFGTSQEIFCILFPKKREENQNPTDQEENVLKSFYLAFKCPHRSSHRKSSKHHEVHISLFASTPDQIQFCLIGETCGRIAFSKYIQ